jgi:hypothetical protein
MKTDTLTQIATLLFWSFFGLTFGTIAADQISVLRADEALRRRQGFRVRTRHAWLDEVLLNALALAFGVCFAASTSSILIPIGVFFLGFYWRKKSNRDCPPLGFLVLRFKTRYDRAISIGALNWLAITMAVSALLVLILPTSYRLWASGFGIVAGLSHYIIHTTVLEKDKIKVYARRSEELVSEQPYWLADSDD